MEIICECGHRIEEHGLLGCIDAKLARWNDCNCKLPKEAVQARYWAIRMAKERDKLKAILYDEGVELRKTRNHYIQACVQRDEIKHKLYKLEDSLYEKDDEGIDEIREQLRMCQLALRTMDSAQAELASYTKIAVDALKKIAPNNPGHVNFGIAQDALDKIKGKF
jgi:hypothetical protein